MNEKRAVDYKKGIMCQKINLPFFPLAIKKGRMPKTPPSLLPPFIDQSKQSFFTNSNEQRDDNEGLIEWDSFERLEREYEQTYLEDNTKTVSSLNFERVTPTFNLLPSLLLCQGGRQRLL